MLQWVYHKTTENCGERVIIIPSHREISKAGMVSWNVEVIHTVEPVDSGHPRNLRNWPLNTESLKILTGRGLMAYHTRTLYVRKQ